MIPFRIRSANAGWKALLIALATLIGGLLSCFPASGQPPSRPPAVQAMVKNQPFPYATGVAMDTLLYTGVRAKLLAADRLRLSAQRAIDSLQADLHATRQALDDQTRLGTYDASRVLGLTVRITLLEAEIGQANATLHTAQSAIDELRGRLPRPMRKTLANATPTQIVAALDEYLSTLRKRKWSWSAGALATGLLLGLILAF